MLIVTVNPITWIKVFLDFQEFFDFHFHKTLCKTSFFSTSVPTFGSMLWHLALMCLNRCTYINQACTDMARLDPVGTNIQGQKNTLYRMTDRMDRLPYIGLQVRWVTVHALSTPPPYTHTLQVSCRGWSNFPDQYTCLPGQGDWWGGQSKGLSLRLARGHCVYINRQGRGTYKVLA